ncbi:MAG: hypothetical protein R3B47_07945 [Bacteroidia bacterium]
MTNQSLFTILPKAEFLEEIEIFIEFDCFRGEGVWPPLSEYRMKTTLNKTEYPEPDDTYLINQDPAFQDIDGVVWILMTRIL